jgi:ribosomal protein L37AE/L43A
MAFTLDDFTLETTGLWRCKLCNATFENEAECIGHIKLVERYTKQGKAIPPSKRIARVIEV